MTRYATQAVLTQATLGLFAISLHVACSGADSKNDEANKPAVTNPANLNGAADGGAATTPPATAGDPAGADPAKDLEPQKTKKKDGEDDVGESVDGDGRTAVNEHCCVNGQYFRCPDTKACFGGFDLATCLEGCDVGDKCWDDCFEHLGANDGPKGCQPAPEPPNVDCANGQIEE